MFLLSQQPRGAAVGVGDLRRRDGGREAKGKQERGGRVADFHEVGAQIPSSGAELSSAEAAPSA